MNNEHVLHVVTWGHNSSFDRTTTKSEIRDTLVFQSLKVVK